jgi:hypothetical protein
MFSNPPLMEWPSPKPERNARAAFDTATLFNHFNMFARGREPL